MNEVHIELERDRSTASASYISDLPTAHMRLMEALKSIEHDLAVDRITSGTALKVTL